MNEEEIGQMESELRAIEARVCDFMSEAQKERAVMDLATALLALNERLKKVEEAVSYVGPNIKLNL